MTVDKQPTKAINGNHVNYDLTHTDVFDLYLCCNPLSRREDDIPNKPIPCGPMHALFPISHYLATGSGEVHSTEKHCAQWFQKTMHCISMCLGSNASERN